MHGRWKTHLVIVAIAALLSACGSGDDDNNPAANNHGLGFHFDEQGQTGIRVRYFDDTSPRLAVVEQLYIEMMDCVGVDMPGPLVVFVAAVSDGSNNDGLAWYDTMTVEVKNKDRINRLFVIANLKHDFVHLLLHWSGQLTIEQNNNHESPLFEICPARPSLAI